MEKKYKKEREVSGASLLFITEEVPAADTGRAVCFAMRRGELSEEAVRLYGAVSFRGAVRFGAARRSVQQAREDGA